MTSNMASSDLWYRKFNRSKEDDEDLLATTEIREAYFKDFFGQWLQKGQNANVHTFDELLMEFWSRFWLAPKPDVRFLN